MSQHTEVANQLQKLYLAYYGRPADSGGLTYWTNRVINNEIAVTSIADEFGTSTEFEVQFGALDNTTLINNIYQRLFGRDADPAGLTFYTELLVSGAATLPDIAMRIIDGAQGDDVQNLENRVIVATSITDQLGTLSPEQQVKYTTDDLPLLTEHFNGITHDPLTIDGLESGVKLNALISKLIVNESSGVRYGSWKDDVIDGSNEDDTINGMRGNDILNGNGGNDHITGGLGADTLNGNLGDDSLFGDAGDDILSGGQGNDLLVGGDGNDTLTGGQGDDLLEGGAGDDLINADEFDIIDGGTGVNTVAFNADVSAANLLDNDLQSVTNINITNTSAGIYDFSLQSQNLTVIGDIGSGNSQITTGVSDDSLIGGGGDDILISGDGDDILVGSGGIDTLTGGLGLDTFVISTTNTNLTITDFTVADDDFAFVIGEQATVTTVDFASNGSVSVLTAASSSATVLGANLNILNIAYSGSLTDMSAIAAFLSDPDADLTTTNKFVTSNDAYIMISDGTDAAMYEVNNDEGSSTTILDGEIVLLATITGLADLSGLVSSVDVFVVG